MTPKQKRFLGVCLFFIPLSLGMFFLMSALRNNIVYFISPSELYEQKITNDKLTMIVEIDEKLSFQTKLFIPKEK